MRPLILAILASCAWASSASAQVVIEGPPVYAAPPPVYVPETVVRERTYIVRRPPILIPRPYVVRGFGYLPRYRRDVTVLERDW